MFFLKKEGYQCEPYITNPELPAEYYRRPASILSQNLIGPKTITIQTTRWPRGSIVLAQFKKEKLKSPMSPRKSVSFNKNVHMRLTIYINDYTAEEGEACLYSCENYIKMSNDVRCTANMIEEEEKNSTIVFDDVHCCRRGCEKRTQNGSKRTLRRRQKAVYHRSQRASPPSRALWVIG
jgi:hypothetical protein